MPVMGAHEASPVRVPPFNTTTTITIMAFKQPPLLFLLLFLFLSLHCIASSALTDSEILLKFKESLSNASALDNWDIENGPCTSNVAKWDGVICVNGSVWGLQLENMGLAGKIDVKTLEGLPELKTLSFMNNNFEGSMPELKKLGGLRSLFLSNNRFSGVIREDAFEGMTKLKKVCMAQNEFEGAIPLSLSKLPKLLELRLEGNQFTGQVPEFSHSLQAFNVSNNALEGPIPASLSEMDSSSFSGNNGLCGQPLDQCASTTTSSSPTASDSNSNSKTKKPSVVSIVTMAIVAALALAAIIGAVFILLRRQKHIPASIEAPTPSNLQTKTGLRDTDQGPNSSPDQSGNGRKSDSSKLSFVRDDRERFDLCHLLKASAEILGSGCFGSSYKAAVSAGQVMVVKRFKQMNNVGKEEFQEHMRRLGRLRHPNLLPLVAYYYRKEEKLLVSDFVEKGSLAVHLHGHQALGLPSLDWATRLKIVKGIARGLAYLSKELPSIIAAHGHLKSSNILLKESYEPLLTDYGLVPVINQESAQELMVAYKSPEYIQHGRITKKTDVWSLGTMILEILTGKFPANSLSQGKGSEEEDLADWVKGIPEKEWSKLVLDKEIGTASRIGTNEAEMLKLLRIGLGCCEPDVEKRIDMRDAIERIEELKEIKDNDEDFYSSYASDADVASKRWMSRGMSDDFNFS